MVHYFFRCEPLLGVVLQDLAEKVFAFGRYPFWDLKLPFYYLLIQFISVRIFKWQISAHHRKQDDAATPHVYLGSVIGVAFDHFRSSVAGRATCSFQKLTFLISIAEAKINQFYLAIMIQE